MSTSSKHLAAIMFTDIVGYTKLMGSDETKAMELVQKNRTIQISIVGKYNGKLIKEMGDGTMSQFDTALDAVNCAVEIQRAAKSKISSPIRIGIHLGDLIFDNNDVYGDGVNIASRLESKATPGGIYISETIYNIIKGKDELYFKFVGELALKNVKDPIRTYAVIEKEEADYQIKKDSRSVRNQSLMYTALVLILIAAFFWGKERGIFEKEDNKPVITVLPFTLVEGGEEDQYLIDGLSEELIRNLGKIKSFLVTNSFSTKRYLGSISPIMDLDKNKKTLHYIVKGTFQKRELNITIDIEVFDDKDISLFSKPYSDDMANLPELIGSIAFDISEALDVKLNDFTRSRLVDVESVNPDVYALWLKGMTEISKYRFREQEKSITYFEQAKDKHPGDARAWAGLAECYVNLGHSPAAPPDAWPKAKRAAQRAIQLDSTLAEAWAALAHTKTYFEWDYDGAEICYQKANELNPNLAMNHYHYSWHSFLFDRIDLAIEEHRLAQSLDPFNLLHTNWLIFLLVDDGQFQEARKEIKRSLKIQEVNPLAYFQFGKLLKAEGKMDSAALLFDKAGKEYPGIRYMGSCQFNLEQGNIEKGMECVEEIKNLNLNSFTALQLASMYCLMDSVDQYFEYVNYEPAHAWAPWQRLFVENANVINDPRFKQLMDKMNLPMPKTKTLPS